MKIAAFLRSGARSLGLLLALAGCQPAQPPLEHDAYIWQRHWTPALDAAIAQSAAKIRDWRVLAAQTDAHGELQLFAPDRAILAASGRPVVLVVRIDGQLVQWDEEMLIRKILALRADWQRHGEIQPTLAGIEIDHDCGTARLPAYAHFLTRLKQELGATRLSITALPAWMSSVDLTSVLTPIDEAVLQVHAVQAPHAGLFEAPLARKWIDRFAARIRKPFRVALPTYGSRVSWDSKGELFAVQSESAMLSEASEAKELAAAPAEVAQLLTSLRKDRPKGLVGIAWFRLPTTNDERAWSLSTWHQVMRGAPLSTQSSAHLLPSGTAGASDVVLRNDGEIDVSLPRRIVLPAACTIADGVNGYALTEEGGRYRLTRTQDGWLHAHQQRAVGWARCNNEMTPPQIDP